MGLQLLLERMMGRSQLSLPSEQLSAALSVVALALCQGPSAVSRIAYETAEAAIRSVKQLQWATDDFETISPVTSSF